MLSEKWMFDMKASKVNPRTSQGPGSKLTIPAAAHAGSSKTQNHFLALGSPGIYKCLVVLIVTNRNNWGADIARSVASIFFGAPC